jgi:hypothetical protein
LLNNIAKLTEKAVAQYLTLEGETTGWWHEGQFGSRPGRNTTDALMWLKNEVAKNRKNRQNTAVIMTDIVTAFPGTQPSTVLQTLAPLVDPVIYRWIDNWLAERSISICVDVQTAKALTSNCGIPQGSPISPVLFGLVWASALKQLPTGASYVNDCTWAIPFTTPHEL